jgi:PAS domain S-box-containing protein
MDLSASSLDHTLVTAFLENVPDKVYFKDRASRFIAVSRSTLRHHGLTDPAEMLGKTDVDFFTLHQAECFRRDEEDIMSTGVPIIDKIEQEAWADGHSTWALSSKIPLRDSGGAIVGTFGITKDITKSKQTEVALELARKDLMDATRLAGMAEVAIGVLHNVGNVLNSVNVSATDVMDRMRQFKVENLAKLCAMLREHRETLGAFLTHDPKGNRVIGYLETLAQSLDEQREHIIKELESLQKNVDHIKEIVAMQQAYATMVGVRESMEASTLMEDALRMNSGALARHDVQVIRAYQSVRPVIAERGKVLQILVNLIRNAKYACDERGQDGKTLTLGIENGENGRVRLVVRDNGIGILRENITRIFNHGFTTRVGGHGFGLHSSALAAKEMNGVLTVFSNGVGTGATFTLELPAAPASRATATSVADSPRALNA